MIAPFPIAAPAAQQARRRARLTAGPELVRLRKEIDDVPVALAANDYRRGMARP